MASLEPALERVAQHLLAALRPELAGFASRVREHRLGPVAYQLAWSEFRNDYLGSLLMAERRRDDLAQLTERLDAEGIEALPIKGMSYVGWLYTDPALRPMSDIDLLVRPSRHGAASASLESLGYRRCTSKPGSRSRFHHATTFNQGRQYVDLHRNIVQPLRADIDTDALLSRAHRGLGQPFAGLSLVDTALVHFAHIARSELAVPVINYLDGALLLCRMSAPQMHELQARSRRYRIARGIDSAIDMTRSVTEGAPWRPIGVRSRSLPRPAEILHRAPISRPLQVLRKLTLCDDLRSVAGLITGALIERR